MPKVLGVDFAPRDIPFERRMQTLAVCATMLILPVLGMGPTFLLIYLLFFTQWHWVFAVIYLTYLYFDFNQPQTGGRRIHWLRNLKMWEHVRDYFPVRLIKTAELDPKNNYIAGYHPHGIFASGAFLSLGTEAVGFRQKFPAIRSTLLTLTGQFRFPIYREFIMALGLCSVSADSIQWLLNNEGRGNLVTIVIGGAAEALDAHAGIVRLTIKRRRGFVRLALQNGAHLVPIFSFGENELYSQIPNPEGSWIRTFQNWYTKFVGLSPPIIIGRGVFQYTFGYLPYRKAVDLVVGKPIELEKNENPTPEEIAKYHDLYIEELKRLFDTHKVNYEDYKNTKLEIA